MVQAVQVGAWAVLVACLTLMPALPEVANVIAIAGMALGIPLLIADLRAGYRLSAAEWLVVGATVVLILALIPTTRSADNFAVLLALAPLPLSIPLAALLARLGDRLTLPNVATLALLGTVVAAGVTGYDIFVRGIERGGYLTMNPIHMADIAIVLGLLSFAGVLEGDWRRRLVFLVGPVLAFLAVFWSGSRGPLLAYAVLACFSAAFVAAIALPARYRAPTILGMFAVVALIGIHGLLTGWLIQVPGVDQILNIAGGQAGAVDSSTRTRLYFYEGAWEAFLSSPIYGHGLGFVAAAASFVTGEDISGWDHLHSDIADFATMAGVLGLLVYTTIIATPLAASLWRRPISMARLYIGMAAGLAVLCMGLTNAVFGILTLTVLFGLVLALSFRIEAETDSPV